MNKFFFFFLLFVAVLMEGSSCSDLTPASRAEQLASVETNSDTAMSLRTEAPKDSTAAGKDSIPLDKKKASEAPEERDKELIKVDYEKGLAVFYNEEGEEIKTLEVFPLHPFKDLPYPSDRYEMLGCLWGIYEVKGHSIPAALREKIVNPAWVDDTTSILRILPWQNMYVSNNYLTVALGVTTFTYFNRIIGIKSLDVRVYDRKGDLIHTLSSAECVECPVGGAPEITADGRYMCFKYYAENYDGSNLMPPGLCLYDLETGELMYHESLDSEKGDYKYTLVITIEGRVFYTVVDCNYRVNGRWKPCNRQIAIDPYKRAYYYLPSFESVKMNKGLKFTGVTAEGLIYQDMSSGEDILWDYDEYFHVKYF